MISTLIACGLVVCAATIYGCSLVMYERKEYRAWAPVAAAIVLTGVLWLLVWTAEYML